MFEINFDKKRIMLSCIEVPYADRNISLSKITLNNHILKLYGTLYNDEYISNKIIINLNNVATCDVHYVRNNDDMETSITMSEKENCHGFTLALNSVSIQLVSHDEEMKKQFFVLLEKIEQIMERDILLDTKSKIDDVFDFLVGQKRFNENKKKNFYSESDEEN